VEKWSHTWQMCFNAAKCSVILVGEKNSDIIYTLNNTRLSNIESHPYLGIEFSYYMKWTNHINKIITNAYKNLAMIKRVLKSADTKTKLFAYYSLVRSKLEYGFQVWDPVLKQDIKIIEKVQNKALHFIFSIRSQVSYSNICENQQELNL